MHVEESGPESNQNVKEEHHVDYTVESIKGHRLKKWGLECNLERYLEAVVNGEYDNKEVP